MGGFPDLSKVSLAQRKKEIFRVTLKRLVLETRKIPLLRSVDSTPLSCQKLTQAQQTQGLTQI